LRPALSLNAGIFASPVYSAVGRANLVPEKERKIQWDTVVEKPWKACSWAEKYGVFIAIEPLNRFETDL